MKPSVSSAELQQEQAKQREVVIKFRSDQYTRAWKVGYPVLLAATPLCADRVDITAGFGHHAVTDYPTEWREAVESVYDLGTKTKVHDVRPGSAAERLGIQVGDEWVGLDGSPVPTGKNRFEQLEAKVDAFKLDGRTTISLTFRRGERLIELDLAPDKICDYPIQVQFEKGRGSMVNAFADGKRIVITSGMLRFANDPELAVILGHELAHNIMHHIDKKKQNATAGAITGGLLDILLALGGLNTGGAFSQQGAKIGAQSYSQDFETEAEYVGLYTLALAGYDLDAAPYLWRKMAALAPSSIAYGGTHPTTPERFLRMEKTVEEIQAKQSRGLQLLPEIAPEPAPTSRGKPKTPNDLAS